MLENFVEQMPVARLESDYRRASVRVPEFFMLAAVVLFHAPESARREDLDRQQAKVAVAHAVRRWMNSR